MGIGKNTSGKWGTCSLPVTPEKPIMTDMDKIGKTEKTLMKIAVQNIFIANQMPNRGPNATPTACANCIESSGTYQY